MKKNITIALLLSAIIGYAHPLPLEKAYFTEPETAYTDVDCSYASNEIAINWNAPLVYLASAIEALQYKVQYSVKK